MNTVKFHTLLAHQRTINLAKNQVHETVASEGLELYADRSSFQAVCPAPVLVCVSLLNGVQRNAAQDGDLYVVLFARICQRPSVRPMFCTSSNALHEQIMLRPVARWT